ncbi:hypothetical protein TNCV_1627591 [Trichonephila clavipes]|nr:hypothetical protein TNCV_1627591 [Trichonephila clavipes]
MLKETIVNKKSSYSGCIVSTVANSWSALFSVQSWIRVLVTLKTQHVKGLVQFDSIEIRNYQAGVEVWKVGCQKDRRNATCNRLSCSLKCSAKQSVLQAMTKSLISASIKSQCLVRSSTEPFLAFGPSRPEAASSSGHKLGRHRNMFPTRIHGNRLTTPFASLGLVTSTY